MNGEKEEKSNFLNKLFRKSKIQKDSASTFIYSWRSDSDPFSSEKNATWEPYNKEDNLFLEEAYQNFLSNKDSNKVKLKKAKDYFVDFSNWHQYSIKNSYNQRPFKRDIFQNENKDKKVEKANEQQDYSIKELDKIAPDFRRTDKKMNEQRDYTKNELNKIAAKNWRGDKNVNEKNDYDRNESDEALEYSWKLNKKVNEQQESNINELDATPEYFWRSDKNPFSHEINAAWSPYDLGDSIFLEKAYQNWIYNKGPFEVDMGSEYKINFKQWIQISKSDSNKQRPISRGRSEKIKFIVRKDRWDSTNDFNVKDNFFSEKNVMINFNINNLKCEAKNQKDHFMFTWEVGNDKIDLKLPKEMNFFKENRLKLNLKEYIAELKIEIKQLSIESEYRNYNNPYEFSNHFLKLENNSSPPNLYQTLAKIYVQESFLYRELNKILRCSHINANYGFKIKYFYVGLMAAMNKLTEKTSEQLKEQFSNDGKTNVIKVFRGGGITKEEIDFYKKNKNAIRQINCFLSTSIKKEVAENFMKNSTTNSSFQALFEYNLLISSNPPFTFLADDLNIYGEEEVLIHSGSIIQIFSIIEITKNQFHLQGTILSAGFKGYFQYVAMDRNRIELNLNWNGLGYGIKENMMYLKDALRENRIIQELHLNQNSFGDGKEENLKLLKDALIENKSIIKLNLADNGFGKGKEENMLHLKEALIENKSILKLNLNYNDFGEEKESNMKLLKDALIKNKKIKILYLDRNGFGTGKKENMKHLKEALFENKSITELNLGSNGFGEGKKKNMKYLKHYLIESKSIQILNLMDNGFGKGKEENMKYLKEGLIENKNIITLNLTDNDFGKGKEENMKYLKEALVENKYIITLFLSENDFGKGNMKYLNEALIENKSIQKLTLENNGFCNKDKEELKKKFSQKMDLIF